MKISIKIESDGLPCSVCKEKIACYAIYFTYDNNKILDITRLCKECMRETAKKFQPYT